MEDTRMETQRETEDAAGPGPASDGEHRSRKSHKSHKSHKHGHKHRNRDEDEGEDVPRSREHRHGDDDIDSSRREHRRHHPYSRDEGNDSRRHHRGHERGGYRDEEPSAYGGRGRSPPLPPPPPQWQAPAPQPLRESTPPDVKLAREREKVCVLQHPSKFSCVHIRYPCMHHERDRISLVFVVARS